MAGYPWIERTTVAPEGMLSQWQEQPDTKNHTLFDFVGECDTDEFRIVSKL